MASTDVYDFRTAFLNGIKSSCEIFIYLSILSGYDNRIYAYYCGVVLLERVDKKLSICEIMKV